MWGGSLLDYDKPVYLVSGVSDLPEVVRVLHKIGMDNIGGYFCADEVANGGFNTENIPQASPGELEGRINSGEVEVIDVRGLPERHEEMIAGSHHNFLGKMLTVTDQFDPDKTYVFQCRTGGRSIIAASIAERAGIKNVINMDGGIEAWKDAMLPVESASKQAVTMN